MQLGELGWRHAVAATVRPALVVVLPPGGDGRPGLHQRLEPLLVEALVPELAIEALDVAVLHGPPRLDQDVADAMVTVPRFHVQQEVDNFWSTEKRNERWQCAQAAIHGRVQDRSHQAVGLGGWPRGRAKAGNSLSDVEQLVAQAQAGGLGAFA